MDEQDLKIAVMENEIKGLREQHKAHKDEITLSLNQVWGVVKEIRTDIKNIFEFINRSRGGLYVAILAASVIGGVVVAFVSAILGHFLK